MALDLTGVNEKLLAFDKLVKEGVAAPFEGNLRVGVDLGTANIVLSVVDENNNPIAGITKRSRVVRDGIVVDYVGAVAAVTQMKQELESRLGIPLTHAAAAIPPGIIEGNARCMSNVVEGAGFIVSQMVDEPTAASNVLGIKSGAVVDVGGGTTGISILKDGEVIFTGDEPTGGFHMTLVLAGYHNLSTDDAEEMKQDTTQEHMVFPIIRPVVEKMAQIVSRYMSGYSVDEIYIVGGACCFSEFDKAFEKYVGVPAIKPAVPLLVTPLGTAMNG